MAYTEGDSQHPMFSFPEHLRRTMPVIGTFEKQKLDMIGELEQKKNL